MSSISASEARSAFAEVLGRVAYGKERITIERRGRPLAALVPIADLEALENGGRCTERESEGLLRALIEGSPVEVGVKDMNGRYIMVSQEFERLNQKTSAEIIGKSPDDIYPRETAEAIRRHDEEVLKTGKTVEWEIDAPLEDGMHTYLVAKFPARDGEGRITSIGAVATDITEQKRAQAALRESEARLQAILNKAPLEISLKDLQGRYLVANKAFQENLAIAEADVLGKTLVEAFPNEDGTPISEMEQEVLESGLTLQREVPTFCADGVRPFLSTKFPIRDAEGRITSVGTISIDVTEQKKTEDALRKSEKRYRSLYESIPISVWEEDWSDIKKVIDRLASNGVRDWRAYFDSHDDELRSAYRLGKTLNVNSMTLQMYRTPTKEAALDLVTLENVAAEELQSFTDWLATLAAGNPTYVTEATESRADGTTFPARIRSFVPPEHSDTWSRVIFTVEDISDRKAVERSLRESEAMLQQAAEMANLGYWVWDEVEDCCLYCSDMLAKLNGVTVDEYYERYQKSSDLLPDVHPEDRDRYDREIQAAARERRAYDIEFRAQVSDGRRRYLRERGEPILGEDGRLLRTVGTLQDISDYKRAETALRTARDDLESRVEERTRELHAINRALEEEIADRTRIEERLRDSDRDLRNLIEGSIQGVMISDEARKPLYVNRACAKIFGFESPEEFLTMESTASLIASHELERLDDIRKRHFNDETAPAAYEFDGVCKDGSIVRLQCMGRVMHWGGKRVAQVTLIDISERQRALEELRSSREMLRAIVDAVPATVSAKDRDSHYIMMNRFQADLYGIEPDQAIGKTAEELIGPEYGAYTRQLDQTVIESGRALPYFEEVVPFEPLAKAVWLTTKVPLKDDQDRIQTLVTVALDITARKQIEENLAQSEERLRQATELAGLGHWVWDAIEDRCIYCSEENARLHGLTVDQYMTEASTLDGAFGLVHPEDHDEVKAAFQALRRGQGFEMEYRTLAPDGEARWVREIAKPVLDESGEVVREFGTIQDIAERRAAEEAIRTREAWLSAILDNSPIEIVLKDRDGFILLANGRSAESIGVTPEEMIGNRVTDYLPADAARVYHEADRQVVERGEPIQQEVNETVDERPVRYLSSKFPLRDRTGQILGVCSLTTDITPMAEMQEQLHQAQKMEVVGQLTGGVAHDFNNLLAIILGNAEYLVDHLGAEDRALTAILRAADRGAELTERLLAFSRRQPLRPQAIDLGRHVAGMSELLARTLGGSIEVAVSTPGGLWQAMADPGQLENALLNLALNARDAMPDGGQLTIVAENVTLDQAQPQVQGEARPGDYVALSVSDTGAGMRTEILEHVFEPFFTTKDVGEGSGLGLSMVYGFAQQSGGFVSLESEPGHGTTVRLHLPRTEDAVPESAREPVKAPAPCGHGERVLVVEDAPDVRELAMAMLENLGYEVVAAENAKAADALLDSCEEIDLLLTDVMLPGGMSGPAFAEVAKQRCPDLKVLFMSGHASDALATWEADLLLKPFRKRVLAERVRELLDRA